MSQSTGLVVLIGALAFSFLNNAFAQSPEGAVLFQNVRVFDGKSSELSASTNVLVRGNKIKKITPDDIPTEQSVDTTIIDCGGRTLMPGLIDAHWHLMLVRPTPPELLANDIGYTTLLAGAEATATLMRGWRSLHARCRTKHLTIADCRLTIALWIGDCRLD